MKHFKLLFSLMLTSALFMIAGCGSGGSGVDPLKTEIHTLNKRIMVQGVVRNYRTGAPLGNIEVRLFQAGEWKKSTTVDHNGHYNFNEVLTFADTSTANANANVEANHLQLSFVELKTKKLDGDGNLVSGEELYENGTSTPTFPDSRVELELTDPEHSEGAAAGNPSNDNNGGTTNIDNPEKPDVFIEANTTKVVDVRLVQTGVLSGKVADNKTGLPVANATVTIDTDGLFALANADKIPTAADDIVAVWQQTRISALSNTTGDYTFTSIPALDYTRAAIVGQTVLHAEAVGYTDTTAQQAVPNNTDSNLTHIFSSQSSIQDDLVGTLGVIFMTPITIENKTFTLKVVDQNLAALSGVTVTFVAKSANAGDYEILLENGIASDTVWTFTSDANGVVTGSVPAINFNQNDDFKVTLAGYKLDTTFSAIVNDEDDLNIDFKTYGGVDKALDLGVVKLIPDVKNTANLYRVQLLYKNAPVSGAAVSGFVKYTDADTSASEITLVVSGDAVSDVNGFVTFTNKIPAKKAPGGLSVKFNLTVNLSGASSLVSGSLTGTYVVDDATDLDLTEDEYTNATVFIEKANTVKQIVIKDKEQKLAALEGYLVTGKADNNTSFTIAANVNVRLAVQAGGQTVNYFAKTDSAGKYTFQATAGVNIPVAENVTLDLTILGDYIFSGDDNTIRLDDPVNAANGVDQIDSNGSNAAEKEWVWQLDGQGTVDQFDTSLDGKIVQVHTAAIEPTTPVALGYHVVSLVKTVAGVNTLPIIETSAAKFGANTKIYTYTKAQDDATGVTIVMSGDVDTTKTFVYNQLTPTVSGTNDTNDSTLYNRISINFGQKGNEADEVADGETLTFTATVSGRNITIVPSGNATKFQTQVVYKMTVRVFGTNGSLSDDTIHFRFYDKDNATYSTHAPTFDVTGMTDGDFWELDNHVTADADNVKIGIDGTNAHFLVYKDVTGLGAATGALQTEVVALNALLLRFPIPTDLRTNATADVNNATIVTEINGNFKVWAQAYDNNGIILQHWTDVTNVAVAVANTNTFAAEEQGYLEIGAALGGSANTQIFAKALAEGKKVDLTVVHKNNQIDPSASKVLTLSSSTHMGVQAKTFTPAAGTFTVDLSEKVNSTGSSSPTMSTTMHGISITNVVYSDSDTITGTVAINYVDGTDVTVDATSTTNTSSGATSMLNLGNPAPNTSVLIVETSTATATLTALANEWRQSRMVAFDVDGSGSAASDQEMKIQRFNTLTGVSIPVVSSTTGTADDWAVLATGAISEPAGAANDDSTTTAVDVDVAGGGPLIIEGDATVATNNTAPNTGRSYNMHYNNLSSGRLKALLANLTTNDVILADGQNFYLRVTSNSGTSLVMEEEIYNTSLTNVSVNSALGYATGNSGNLIYVAQLKLNGSAQSNLNTTGTIELVNDATTTPLTGLRTAFDANFTINDTTTVTVTGTSSNLLIGETVYMLTESSTITDGTEAIYAGIVSGVHNGTANSVVAFSSVTQVAGTTLPFGRYAAKANGFISYGDQVTVGLGTSVTSLVNGTSLNTNGDSISADAFTDDTTVQHDGGKGFEAVK